MKDSLFFPETTHQPKYQHWPNAQTPTCVCTYVYKHSLHRALPDRMHDPDHDTTSQSSCTRPSPFAHHFHTNYLPTRCTCVVSSNSRSLPAKTTSTRKNAEPHTGDMARQRRIKHLLVQAELALSGANVSPFTPTLSPLLHWPYLG